MASSTSKRGERKQITAIFMDIVGFSAVASRADPEDLERWLEAFYIQAREIIEAHDGEVTEYLGDGIVALFGLERGDELAASKAVNAAMAALQEIDAGYEDETPLQLRVGIATGVAAVRTKILNDGRPRATGMVTTLAQRIQERAAPGEVIISERTQALLRDAIATEKLTGEHLRGFAEAQTLFRPLIGQPQVPPQDHPFVGRAGVLQRIKDSTKPTLVVGPAGIGKTALARHLAETATAATVFAADGVQMRASYQPFVQWLQRETGRNLPTFKDISARFAALPDTTRQALALILGLPEGQQLIAQRSNVALKALIEESLWMAIRATQAQGMLIFEDLHWLDNASFGVLTHIIDSKAASHYQILMTSRQDPKIDKFLGDLLIRTVPLAPLSDTEASEMLNVLSQGKVTPNARAYVIERAEGVPLFIQQIFKRSATHTTKRQDVPASLKDLMAAQIDATGPAKPVLQCAAVIGRRFDLATLRAIAAEHEPLEDHLAQACHQGVLQKEGPDTWAFAHALLQQEAYQSMLRQTRISYHAQVADYLQDNHADAIMRNPARLIEHLSLSHQHIPAIQNYLIVSRWALFQGAFEDAETHVLATIALCKEAPPDVDVRALEIAAYTALGTIRMQMQGLAAEPVKDAFDKVSTLAKSQSTYSAANGPAFFGCFNHAVVSADKATAVRFSNLLRETAQSAPDGDRNNELRLASLNIDTALHFYAGEFDKASAAYQALRAEYDIAKHGAMICNYGADTFGAAQMFECATRAICGDAHQITDLVADIDAHQKQLNIPVIQPWAQIWGAVPLYYAGMTDAAVARVRRGLRTAETQTSAFVQMAGTAWLNIMDTSETYSEGGLANFHGVIKLHEKSGANILLPYFRAHYALALSRHDRTDDAYQVSLQATRENAGNGLHCWYPEVLRLHAHICELCGGKTGAARFRKEAAAIATEQNALLWLLRIQLDQRKAGEISTQALGETVGRFHPAAKIPELHFAQHLLKTT